MMAGRAGTNALKEKCTMHDEDEDDAIAAAAAAAIQSDNEWPGGKRGPVVDDTPAPPLQPFSGSPGLPSRGSFHPDVPAGTLNIPGIPAKANNENAGAAIEPQRLLIGRDINLKGGQISSCRHLTLDGQVEDAVLTGAQVLEISPLGTFKGKAEVDEAIIAGRFEGELTARKRLVIRESGSIAGKVLYGTIVIEPGGQVSGEMQSFNDAS
jgi:cytoskeletal protein CcmA (bactofilin family)